MTKKYILLALQNMRLWLFVFLVLTKLVVATGGNSLKSIEVVNLDGSYPNLTCDNLQDYPLGITGAIGHLYQEKIPLICGGFLNEGMLCNCFEFKKCN